MNVLEGLTRSVFFTGKGGVGKTSIACATALDLARQGRRVLLVSTDPASNLDEVLGVSLGSSPTTIPGAPGLAALNVDPEAAARAYRERIVGPYRGVLPAAAVASIEEQLSGACTVEIAAFDEFSKLLGDPGATAGFDHVVFDTAPTGHTLRLLELPAAWSGYLASSAGSTSCLGPLAGLADQRALYEATRVALSNPGVTTVVLVSRPDRSALKEAERTRGELGGLGVTNVRLVVNGVFTPRDGSDPVAVALAAAGRAALADMPPGLAVLPRSELPLLPFGIVGLAAVRTLLSRDASGRALPAVVEDTSPLPASSSLPALVDELERSGHGVVMTVGKGGVGKTTIAATIAQELARRGHHVLLTTTDPAAHVQAAVRGPIPGLRVSRIDPRAEKSAYAAEVLAKAGEHLDEHGRALLEEDLRSPCTEEIAVFRAFAHVVEEGAGGFVVIDTAPTGHTLLLLDAAEAYHREVSRSLSDLPDPVKKLLPRLRDPGFTRVLVVTLAEATPVHEAAALQRDLQRAGIEPFAWVVNQCLTPLRVTDPALVARRAAERRFLIEVSQLARGGSSIVPWSADLAASRAERPLPNPATAPSA